MTVAGAQALLDGIAAEIRDHRPCGFEACEAATNLVPGEGPADARVAIVGEAPGASEDRTGRPFAGNAGGLLDQLLELAGLRREEVFITNVVKGRPPKNRNPRKPEVAHSLPWLEAQLAAVDPALVVAMGRHALEVLAPDARVTRDHGATLERDGRIVMPMYHPAAGLRSPDVRAMLREDAERLGQVVAGLA